MKLKFKHQKFQTDAAKAVVNVFAGQQYQSGMSYLIDRGKSNSTQQEADYAFIGFRNAKVTLADRQVLENIQTLQRSNFIKPTPDIAGIEEVKYKKDAETIVVPTDKRLSNYDLTIEMETGVGKTYTYIKTIFELNKAYGWSKFIVIVPNVAIREGVYKSFEITQEHFMEEYGEKIRFFIYDSKHLNQIDQFANDNKINVMIINSQAFNAKGADARRIDMKLDEFRSRRPIDIIAKTNPILIIDESQSVLGPTTIKSIKKFNPLFTIGYSATHRIPFNMIYRLDAMEAYNKKLVKKIAVKGISVSGSSGTDGYMYLQSINVSKEKFPTATLEFNTKGKTGVKQKKVSTINIGYNLYEQSGKMEEYKDYTVSEINYNTQKVTFLNGKSISVGEVLGNKTDINQIRRIQIRETIESHLERERQLFYKGIKVLSLFFIDEVVKYRDYSRDDEKGIYAEIFEEEYQRIVDHYVGELGDDDYIKYLKGIETTKTHQGYFSQDKKSGHFKDSEVKRGTSGSDDIDAYDLIMKNKEELLNRRNPVRFIFSHSALKEGWDNPNVFQICALKDSKDSNGEIKRRQEIGRGLRLSVNQNGDRMDASLLGEDIHTINTLTVIANESYESFAEGLQDEYAEIVKDRPKVNINLFDGRIIKNEAGETISIDKDLAEKICYNMVRHNYVDDNGVLTDKYYENKNTGNLVLPDEVKDCADGIINILDTIYDVGKLLPEDSRTNTEVKVRPDMLGKAEFQSLWKKINIKSIYAVDFDESELIKKAISALDSKLEVSKIYVKITTGAMNSIDSKQALIDAVAFKSIPNKTKIESLGTTGTKIKYDLVGKLVDETGLTRKCVIDILTGIQKCTFDQFKQNPEDFIIKVSNIINEQKATLIVQHIAYSKIDGTEGTYTTDIFTEPTLKGKLNINAMAITKSIYDHLIYDSKGEKEFAEKLEDAQDVVVYVKLPRGFYISTPVGKYNPDWAIAFNQEHIKHIYFVAETKGSMQTLELRDIEKAKIECAKKHFKVISNEEVMYDVVSNYDELLTKVMT